jgi:2,4-dienoyl-CoA reductase (NADPH2)
MTKEYPLLLSPLQVGPVTLKNRVIFSAHLTNLAENHLPSARQAHYYEERARGGAALIITEEVSVHPTDWAYEKLIDAFYSEVVPYYKYMTDRVHRHGGKIFLQLNHNGSQGDSRLSRRALWSASQVIDPLFGESSKAMDKAEIRELIEYYRVCAMYGREGNFDGIEFQASHSSIMRQFLSPLSNKRTDEYGGSLENRFRIVKEIAAAVRSAIGPDMALGIRLTGEEFAEGGLTLEDTVEIAKLVEKCGYFDYINISIGIATHKLFLVEGTMRIPPVYAAYMSAAVKRAVNLPVVAVGRIKDPKQGEKLLAEGVCDLVGVVRGQISDPFFVAKTMAGEEEKINGCLSCNQDCIGRVGLNKEIGCVQNPYIGREGEIAPDHLPKISKAKKVVVVGAGPAGMEAAIIADKRGHKVVLFEKSNLPGGQIPLAASLPYRAELGDSIRNLTTALEDSDVTVKLNTEANKETIMAEKPDVVIIACGSRPTPIWMAGGQPHVYNVTDWLTLQAELGENVLVVDQIGFYQGAAVVELLADMGKKVKMLSGGLQLGQGLGRTLDLELWQQAMAEKGVELIPNVAVIGIKGNEVQAIDNYSGAIINFEGIDNILVATGATPNDELYKELDGLVEVHTIGDALAPRRLENAIHDGFNLAITL